MDDLTNFRLTAPYRRTIDSPMAQRLCSAAWSHRIAPVDSPEIKAFMRAAGIRAAAAIATDDEMDVLERFEATGWARSVGLVVDSDQGRPHVLDIFDLECQIRIPHNRMPTPIGGPLPIRASDDPHADAYDLVADIPTWVIRPYLDRLSARASYNLEQDEIIRTNRSTGRVTWRQLLDRMPETKEHVLALLAERDMAASAGMAVAA